MYRKGNARRNQSRRITASKRFYFVDNLRGNVLGNVYSFDLNYDIELKIQGRVHSGKLRITVQRQVKLKWEDQFKVFVNKVCKFLRFSNHGLKLLHLVVQKRQVDIFLTSHDHPSLKLCRRYSHLYGVLLGKHDIRAAIVIFCRLEVFIARVEVFFPSSYTKMRPYSPRDYGSQLPSFLCNYFIIRCRNLREPPQDLRARDFEWFFGFFSLQISAQLSFGRFCFTTVSSYQAFFCLSSTTNLNLSDQMRPIQLKFNCSVIDTIWDKLFSFQPIRSEYFGSSIIRDSNSGQVWIKILRVEGSVPKVVFNIVWSKQNPDILIFIYLFIYLFMYNSSNYSRIFQVDWFTNNLFVFLLYKSSTLHVAVRLFSIRSKKW